MNLSDTVLIKENHLRLLGEEAISTILDRSMKMTSFTKKVEIEVENLSELRIALNASPDIIMLDVPNHYHIPYHFGVNLVEMVVKKGEIGVY